MVLSNKKLKLKLKLRAELAQSQAANPDLSSDPQCSLKKFLDSAALKLRLLKREKRRKVRSLQQNSEGVQEGGDGCSIRENNEDEGTKKKKSKKRKRKVEKDGVANGVVKDAKKKKSKKRPDKKKRKKAKTAEKKGDNAGDDKTEASELAKSNSSEQDGDVCTKVYVGGIPYYSTEDDIRSYFEGCGTITEIDSMKFPESGKFRGIAIISFKTEAAAKRALALDGSDMGGFFLKIQPYKATRTSKASNFAPKLVEGYNRIYVGNLPWDITEDQLRKLFLDCSISSIRFGIDKKTGEFQGYAHVDFIDIQSLKTALTLDQRVLCGRPVRITCAVPLKKAGNHTVNAHTADTPTSNGTNNEKASATPTSNGTNNEKASAIGSGKMKRRTCYECGEKGHISSACPKKQTTDSTTS